MQTKNGKNSFGCAQIAVLLTLISVLSCIIGIILGSVYWVYGRDVVSVKLLDKANPESPLISIPPLSAPKEDGFFVAQNGSFTKINESQDDRTIDINTLSVANREKPSFAVRGSQYPLGSLKIHQYLAGIGVDLNFTQTGAVINRVFENSPAYQAGLEAGEIITTVNGKPARSNYSYTPGKNDLTGPMQGTIELVVISGTSNRVIQVSRTYRDNITRENDEQWQFPSSIPYTIEPKGDYVIIHIEKSLEPGIYGFEFPITKSFSLNTLIEQTPTPSPVPASFPKGKWIFLVE